MQRGFDHSSCPSASLASRDILFPALWCGRNPAECRPFGPFIRTTRRGSEAHFGPFPVSPRPLSLTQPNHGHFGTDVESSIIQWVGGRPKGVGFEKAPLRRSEQGSNYSIWYGSCASSAGPAAASLAPVAPPVHPAPHVGRARADHTRTPLGVGFNCGVSSRSAAKSTGPEIALCPATGQRVCD